MRDSNFLLAIVLALRARGRDRETEKESVAIQSSPLVIWCLLPALHLFAVTCITSTPLLEVCDVLVR